MLIDLDVGSTVCSEGDGYLDVCAVISDLPAGGLETDFTVFFNITSTAVNSPGIVTDFRKNLVLISFLLFPSAAGDDFQLTESVSVVINNSSVSNGSISGNQSKICTGVGIVDDDIYEGNEEFLVDIVSVSPSSVANIRDADPLFKNITDNEGWCISHFAQQLYSSSLFSRCYCWFRNE